MPDRSSQRPWQAPDSAPPPSPGGKTAPLGSELGEEGFRLLVESVEDYALFMLDPAGRIVSWNVGAERIKGYRAEEILGRHFSVFFLEEELSTGLPQRLLDEAEARGRVRSEGWRVRADGSRFPAYAILTALRDTTGALRGFAKVTRDITARRETEAQLREARAELRRHENMSQLGALLAGVAHEVRNPLFGISATLDAFEARYGHCQEPARYLTVLRNEVSRLHTLMHGLLTYGRSPTTELHPCSLSGVLAEAVDVSAPLAREREVRVEVHQAPELPRVPMDPGRLAQAFQNLLSNALHHSPRAGTVSLTVRALPAEGPLRVECMVRDQGPGFSPEDIPRAFEPFFTRRHGGVGLGLSIVQRIVEEHRGTVSLGNGPEGGAEVRVCLPAVGVDGAG